MFACSLQLTENAPWPGPLRKLADAGFPLVNLPMGAAGVFRLASDAETLRLRSELRQFGLGVDWVHAPYGDLLSLVADDDGERALALASHTFLLTQAARLEARAMVFHPYWRRLPAEVPVSRATERLTDAFRQLAERGRAVGVVVCLENLTADFSNVCTEAVLDAVPELRLCFDAGHTHLAGNARRWLPRYAGRVGAVHLHDNDGPAPGRPPDDQHRLPGAGTIRWPEVHALLTAAGYRGPWSLEVHADPDPDAAARAYRAVTAIARGEQPAAV